MENNEYTYTEDLGEIKISDDVISVCVANAVLRTRGVASLARGLTNTLSKTIRKKENSGHLRGSAPTQKHK